jgi:hypothetical protein
MEARFKISLIVVTLFLFACGQQTQPKERNVETKLDTAKEQPKAVEQVTSTINFPCSPEVVKTRNYKNDTKGFFVKITSVCLDDNAIIDTMEKTPEKIVLAQNSNYKHVVFLQTGNDSATYTITKDLVKADNLTGNEVLINPQIPKTAFEPKDNSIRILFTFSEPNATEIRKVKFKVSLKGGIKFMGVVDE